MRSTFLFLICAFVLSGIIAWAVLTPPEPLPADAPPAVFSAERAMADVAVIAARPHPTGSDANRQVRDYLIGRMSELGLEPRIQGAEASFRNGETFAFDNLIGVMPGRDRTAPALALMAHYDSTPHGPGAGDDAAGVAAVLEIVRALSTGEPPERDIMVVLTDAEELGLFGARAFFANDPAADRVGFVINLEARGSSGRAMMFETGAANGETLRRFAAAAQRPLSNSLMVFVYERMPNGTDFTIAREHGLQGLNFAFLGKPADYHADTDTPDNLDRRSLQDIGAQALAASRAFAAGRLPQPSPNLVYSDVLGLGLIAYPAWGGWLVLLAGAGLWLVAFIRARRRSGWTWRGELWGVAVSLMVLIVAGGAAWLTNFALMNLGAPLLSWIGWIELGALASGLVLILAAAFGAGRAGPGAWTGVLAVALAAAAAVQALVPAAAPVILWPLLPACLAAALNAAGAIRNWRMDLVVAALMVPPLAFIGVMAHMSFIALLSPLAFAPFIWIALALVWPLASRQAHPA